ncbi:CRISPR-associated protein [Enhydrobacter aerosaccus]|jgi:CRISPR-associated Csx2 family protein|uniref:CRISPR-associated protein n=1 Tax=Enhydrobacter aerosaccus TaxID=225324 RepID=A0ABR5INB5_9HYPH|nr:TIGR02221 family CRISPR-associated protein [Enhydrobacter aerosaccus]KND22582.1 CRISPR-associated protein [Enhydrobacter aerosaccus]
MTTLISFLGVGNKQNGGYRTTNYEFTDGQVFNDTRYIGMTLAEKLQPTKIILLGTAGSMWDVFLEQAGDNLAEHWLNLSEAVENRDVTLSLLQPFEKFLSDSLNAQVNCVLIPFARTPEEQIQILSVLADSLENNEKVILDVTHGFRHLPMLSLVAARFLKKVKQIDVTQIYYGAFEMAKDGKTPILELESLLTMLDWIDGLTVFDKDGDYAQFADLLAKEGMEETQTKLLKQSAFFERTNNSSQARQKLSTVMNALSNFDSPIYQLFKPQLLKRLHWFKRANRGLQEQQLAKDYLDRHDYLRAVIFALEGMISTKTIEAGKDVNNYADREEQRQILRDNANFRLFGNIRNGLVHGLGRDAGQDIKRIVSDEDKMKQSLKDRFKHLLD